MKLRLIAILIVFASAISLSALESVPKTEYYQRRVALANKLEGGIAVVFAAEEPVLDFMPYRQDEDFYYLTGWNEPGAALVIIGPGPETKTRLGDIVPAHGYSEILFLPARNLVIEKYTGAKMDAATAGAAAATGFDAVMPMTALPEVMTKFIGEDRKRGQSVWSQLDNTQAKASVDFSAASLGIGTGIEPHDVRTLTMALRSVKSASELELIRKAADASIASQLAGMRAIKPGVRERTVAGIEIAKMMEQGSERVSLCADCGVGRELDHAALRGEFGDDEVGRCSRDRRSGRVQHVCLGYNANDAGRRQVHGPATRDLRHRAWRTACSSGGVCGGQIETGRREPARPRGNGHAG